MTVVKKTSEEVKLPNGLDEALLYIKYCKKELNQRITTTISYLQPSAYLLKAATAVSRPSAHWCAFDTPQKAASVKADLFTCGSGTIVFC